MRSPSVIQSLWGPCIGFCVDQTVAVAIIRILMTNPREITFSSNRRQSIVLYRWLSVRESISRRLSIHRAFGLTDGKDLLLITFTSTFGVGEKCT